VVEYADKHKLFASPRHPYTQALLSAIPIPQPGAKRERMLLQGDVPNPIEPPSGCRFRTRCPYARERCAQEVPALRSSDGHSVACHFWEEIAPPPGIAVEAPGNDRLVRLQAAFRTSGAPAQGELENELVNV
jgi:oligopeptide transport system ATP-binding protein